MYDQSMEYFVSHSIIVILDATIVCNELPPSINKTQVIKICGTCRCEGHKCIAQ